MFVAAYQSDGRPVQSQGWPVEEGQKFVMSALYALETRLFAAFCLAVVDAPVRGAMESIARDKGMDRSRSRTVDASLAEMGSLARGCLTGSGVEGGLEDVKKKKKMLMLF